MGVNFQLYLPSGPRHFLRKFAVFAFSILTWGCYYYQYIIKTYWCVDYLDKRDKFQFPDLSDRLLELKIAGVVQW
jgi:hypothetical protein